MRRARASVVEIPRLADADYDALLAENVVFLRLVDAAAVNTVLECAARDAPLVVNRLPAVEEALGADYPGLYDDDADVPGLLTPDNIQRMHEHLRDRVDKSRLLLSTFHAELREALGRLCGGSCS